MSDTALAKVLQSDYLTIDEPEILSAVRDWAAVNSVSYPINSPIITDSISMYGMTSLIRSVECNLSILTCLDKCSDYTDC